MKKYDFNKLENSNILNIKLWSNDITLVSGVSVYKFFFITDYFDKDFNSLMLQKM